MKKLLLLLAIYMVISVASFAQWKTLASDPTGDGAVGGATYLDGTKLEYNYDDVSDSIWFRVTVANVLTANYGINIIMNVTGAGATANWFGTNNSFGYNRVITAWITSGSSGTVGITDAAGFGASNFTKLGANNIKITVDATAKTYTLGMKRTSIFNDTVLNATVIAGVGSNMFWDDDVPDALAGAIHAKPLGIGNISAMDAGYNIFPNPTNGIINISRNTGAAATIHVYNALGQGVYAGAMQASVTLHSFDISNQAKGLYHIRISTDKATLTQSIIVK